MGPKKYTTQFLNKLKKINYSDTLVSIASLVGHPRTGKSSFIRAFIEEKFPNQNHSQINQLQNTTLKLMKYSFLTEGFSIVDTCGYYFELDPTKENKLTEHDEKMMVRLLDGIREGVAFSKETNENSNEVLKDQNDTTNQVTNLVFVINARQLYKPIKIIQEKPENSQVVEPVSSLWSYFWFFVKQAQPESQPKPKKIIKERKLTKTKGVKYAKSLFYACIQILRENSKVKQTYEKIKGDNYNLHWKIVITHMDMIPKEFREQFKIEVERAFGFEGVEKFVYGEKECEWDEKDLQEHEKRVKELLQKVPEGKDYTNVLTDEERQQLHISFSYCKKRNSESGCEHKFTQKTLEKYRELIRSWGVN